MPVSSTFSRVQAIVDRMVDDAAGKEAMAEHQELVGLIEASRHLLIGAKALTAYMDQRFTRDTDYVVGRQDFRRFRKWLQEKGIGFEDQPDVLQSVDLGIDILNAGEHPVLKEILKHENGLASPEALAATKYAAMVSQTRNPRKKYLDIADFAGLVALPGFKDDKFLAYLVDRFEEQHDQARELIGKIRRNELPWTI